MPSAARDASLQVTHALSPPLVLLYTETLDLPQLTWRCIWPHAVFVWQLSATRLHFLLTHGVMARMSRQKVRCTIGHPDQLAA